MNPAFLGLLWPVIEGAVGRHVKNKRQAENILGSVRASLDEGLSDEAMPDEAIWATLSQQRQHQLNHLALQQRSVYLAGWRPLAGWACALGVAWVFLGAPLAQTLLVLAESDIVLPQVPTDYLFELLLGLLGMAGIRSFDKLKGRTDRR